MPVNYTIQQGDSVIALSDKYGLLADTIWNDGANSALREKRPDMNILVPGDVIYIPDPRERLEKRATGAKYRFRRKGIPGMFRLQVFERNIPRAGEPFRLEVDGKPLQAGSTDAKGIVSCFVPARARKGQLTVGEGPNAICIPLLFGYIEPISEISGIQQRLTNLGYDCGEPDGHWNEQTCEALRDFQRVHGLDVTGVCDDATHAKIEGVHDAPYTYPDPQSGAQ